MAISRDPGAAGFAGTGPRIRRVSSAPKRPRPEGDDAPTRAGVAPAKAKGRPSSPPAKKAGAITSFDLNYREKLWSIWGGSDAARGILSQIVSNTDVLVGNEEDLQKGLGIQGPEVKAESALDPAVFLGMIEDVREKFPGVKAVATTLREVHSTHRHTWSAVAWVDGETVHAPTCDLEVLDRVGGGDGFASGFFYGLLSGATPQEAVSLGWAHGALLTTTPGDTSMVTLEQVRAFAKGGSARIQR